MKTETNRNYRFYLLFICLISSLISTGQLENTNWYFGIQTALNFNDGSLPPTLLTDSAMNAEWSAASVSDNQGNLLFYTNGKSIWDASHQIMANGNNILGNTGISQDVVIVPVPNDPTKYYVFHNAGNEMGFTGVSYSIVNMTLNEGLGDIDTNEKNILLQGNPCIRMTTVFNTADNSYWLLLFGASDNPIDSDTLYSYKIDGTGISLTNSTTVVLPFVQSNEQYIYGQMKVSPDAQTLALVYNRNDDDGKFINNAQSIYTFDFDINTGIVSNLNSTINLNDNLYSYGLEFSPDSNLLYVSGTHKLTDQSMVGRIYQIDYRGMSGTTVLVNDLTPIYGMQSGIDQNIYAANATGNLHLIDAPNTIGIGAGFSANAINIGGNGGREFPQPVSVSTATPKSLLTSLNTSFANDTITRVEALSTGMVVFGQIGSDNADNLPAAPESFVAQYTSNGELVNAGIAGVPYSINLPLEENSFAWTGLQDGVSLNGSINKNYKLSKYNGNNELIFEVNTTNINEELIEDESSQQTWLLFETTSYQDFSITGATGRTWAKSATQEFSNDGTQFTKTLNLARFDLEGVLVTVIELANYKWSRTSTEGTVAVSYPAKVVGDNNTLYFTISSQDEGPFTDAAVINLNSGETHRKGEWLISYNTRTNTYKKAKLIGQIGSLIPNELIINQSTLFRKRKSKLYKLDENLADIDSLTLNQLEVLDVDSRAGTFIVRGENTRTLKKVDSNFNELWSQSLGRRFAITAASEAADGSVYYAASYTEEAQLFNDEGNLTIEHSNGNDVFLGRLIPNLEPMETTVVARDSELDSTDQDVSLSPASKYHDIPMYPNPFNDKLDLRLQPGNYTIELYTISGLLVYRKQVASYNSQNFEVQTDHLKNGMYNVRVIQPNATTISKNLIKI